MNYCPPRLSIGKFYVSKPPLLLNLIYDCLENKLNRFSAQRKASKKKNVTGFASSEKIKKSTSLIIDEKSTVCSEDS